MKNKEVYTYKNNEVLQNGEVWAVAANEHNAEIFATALNNLIDFLSEINDKCKEEHWKIDSFLDVLTGNVGDYCE